jgi:hypothetical protein
MKRETKSSEVPSPEASPSPRDGFITFSFGDVSGAMRSSQARQLVAQVKRLWQRVLGRTQ